MVLSWSTEALVILALLFAWCARAPYVRTPRSQSLAREAFRSAVLVSLPLVCLFVCGRWFMGNGALVLTDDGLSLLKDCIQAGNALSVLPPGWFLPSIYGSVALVCLLLALWWRLKQPPIDELPANPNATADS